jgi:serine/threonine-protein kinase
MVALKLLTPTLSHDPRTRERFEHEARAASALDHPNICTIHEIGETDEGDLFIAMAYYEGQTLDRMIESNPPDPEEALRLAIQMAEGLAASHRHGIVHRDIKPGNVMVASDGRLKILDFGLAKTEGVHLTTEGQTMGTVAYMSPEQARGDPVDARTDIWSFGALLYELLTGERPFRGEYAQAVLYNILHESPRAIDESTRHIPPHITALVSKCLEKESGDRYESMDQVLAELQGRQPSPGKAPKTTPNRRRLVYAGAVVLVVALVLTMTGPLRDAALGFFGEPGVPGEKHIVVVAKDLSGQDEEGIAFTDGVVETLISSLQRLESADHGLWVVPTERAQSADLSTPEAAGRDLGVNLVLAVKSTRIDDQNTIDLSLVDTRNGKVLRSASVEVPLSAMTGLQGKLVEEVARLLDLDLSPVEQRDLLTVASTEPGAYEFYNQGLGYLRKYREGRNLEASIILFKRALMQDSSFALAHAGLCEAYWRTYEEREETEWVDKAEASCDRALEFNSELADVYVTMGRLHTGTGRYGTAIAEFQLALARNPNDADALGGLARAYEKLGRLDEAEETYKKAIALKPDYWGGYRDLGVFYFNLARYEEAIEQFQLVADLNPFNARAYSNMGAMYFYLERYPEAIRMFELALEIEPDAAIYSNIATLYYYQGQYDDAAEAYKSAIDLGEGTYEAWGYLAAAYEWAGKTDDARQAHQKAAELAEERLEINRRDQEVLGHLASYYAYLDNREKALEMLKRVIAESPTDPQDLSRIGEAYERLGMRREAIHFLEEALKRGYALTEIVDYPGFADLLADSTFKSILAQYQSTGDG